VERVLHSIGQTIREQGQRKAINIIDYNINKKPIGEYIACAMNSSVFYCHFSHVILRIQGFRPVEGLMTVRFES